MEYSSEDLGGLDPIHEDEFTAEFPGDKMHFFATRERTLETPMPMRSSQTYGEDPILSWVNSLPFPTIPLEELVDDGGEMDEGKWGSDSTGTSHGREFNHGTPLNDISDTENLFSPGTFGSTKQISAEQCATTPEGGDILLDVPNLLQKDGSCREVSENSVNDNQSSEVKSDKGSASSTAVIDLTGSECEEENTSKDPEHHSENGQSCQRKRSLDLISPGPCKKVILQNDGSQDVIEVGEDFSQNERASSVGSFCSASSDILLSPSAPLPNPRMMRDIVRRYIKRRDEMKIIIHHAKVVQKSYGSEKRFFCPPPCVRLVGDGWITKKRRKNVFASSSSSPMPSPLNSPGSGNVTKASDVCAFIGVVGGDNEMQQLRLDTTKGYAAAKNLHTPDSDKRKHFELNVKMFYGDGSEIGRFLSKRIKVISKPSKKAQSIKNPELCIASGTKVSFFNRIRSQTVSTRYLHATKEGFCASSTQWGAFHVYLTGDDGDDSTRFEVLDGYIHYGDSVKIVCPLSGIALPRLVIRKVDKHDAIIDTDEPVAQFHKCAMFLHNTHRQYLCLSQDKVIAHTASQNNENVHKLNSGSCWTIISTEKAEYCWSDSSLHLSNTIGVTPVPVIHSLQINGGGQMAMIELIGENFTPNLTLWFSTVQANTMYRCEESLICVVPGIKKIKPDWKFVKEPIKVPLVLTRDDGLLYPTHINFFYMPEPSQGGAPNPTIREILRSNKFDLTL